MPRDPTKQSVLHDFPRLPYDIATGSIVELQVAEGTRREVFVTRFPVYVRVWEYGYYFLNQFLRTARISKGWVGPAAQFSEGHDSLRSSFVMLTYGYPADAIATLRRVHESFVKACDCAWSPGKTVAIVRAKDLRPSERRLGLQLDDLLSVAASFVHGNRLSSLRALIAIQEDRVPEVRYGPGHDESLARYAATVSIFWLYFGVKVATAVFDHAVDPAWSALQADSAALLRGYLTDAESGLVTACDSVEAMLEGRSAGRVPRP